ncbi:hypothetical protein N7492_000447 [Penicillium capsulatum]|uniref:Uncharacterized protein n=1 Tax=Penicillium capsulatum TaxID=69766 RepID=A0A9W9LYJ5_9EURO|nr:hypothetical protein N7492_000447 [Penicillium capsulatum]
MDLLHDATGDYGGDTAITPIWGNGSTGGYRTQTAREPGRLQNVGPVRVPTEGMLGFWKSHCGLPTMGLSLDSDIYSGVTVSEKPGEGGVEVEACPTSVQLPFIPGQVFVSMKAVIQKALSAPIHGMRKLNRLILQGHGPMVTSGTRIRPRIGRRVEMAWVYQPHVRACGWAVERSNLARPDAA